MAKSLKFREISIISVFAWPRTVSRPQIVIFDGQITDMSVFHLIFAYMHCRIPPFVNFADHIAITHETDLSHRNSGGILLHIRCCAEFC